MGALYDSKSKTLDDKGIKNLLSPDAKYQAWLTVEAALAKAQGELGVIPVAAATHINEKAQIENLDFVKMVMKNVVNTFTLAQQLKTFNRLLKI